MYNHGDMLSIETTTVTPRTPEIINDLVAISVCSLFPVNGSPHSSHNAANLAAFKLNQCDSHSSCSGSPLDSPTGTNAPPSVAQTRSNLVKATLKRQLETKRKSSSCGDSSENDSMKMAKLEYNDSGDEDDDDDTDSRSMGCNLTPEDEDRRRRRRERNKIAATKCRKKKRERTDNLNTESEVLETQNVDLKAQVRQLELERRKLTKALQCHDCGLPGGFQLPAPTTISVARFLDDLSTSNTSGAATAAETGTRPAGRNAQPIPSVNTIGKFGHTKAAKSRSRAGQQVARNQHQQQQQQLQLAQSQSPHPNNLLPVSSGANATTISTSSTVSSVAMDASSLPQLQQPQPQHQQPPLIDIGSYLAGSASAVDHLLPNTYCKPSPNEHALSPDSGFMDTNFSTTTTLAVPLDFMHHIQNLNNSNNNNNNNSNNVNNNIMQPQHHHLKTDYIPSPTSHNSLLDALHQQHDQYGQPTAHSHQQHQQSNQNQQQNQHHHQIHSGHAHAHLIGPGDGSEFALKCELVDSVGHSPYTTEQSGDRFLYEPGVDGGDSSPMFSDNSNLCGGGALEQADLKMLVAASQQQQHLNNNNSLNGHNGGVGLAGHNGSQHHQHINHQQLQQQQQPHQQQQQQHHHQQQQQQQLQHMNSGGNGAGIIEFGISHGSNMFDSLKADYQQSDFLSLADTNSVIGNDTHFTDMDSGIATYTNFLTNTGNGGNNGCMA